MSIFVTNAQDSWGAAIVHELVEKSKQFPFVKAGVENLISSGDLMMLGACVLEMSMKNPDKWHKHMDGVKTMVLVPACRRSDVIEQAKMMLETAEKCQVENIIFCSQLGVQSSDTFTARMFRQLEDMICSCKCKSVIVRVGEMHEYMFTWASQIRKSHELRLPIDGDSVKWAPLGLQNFTSYIAHMLTKIDSMSNKQIIKLTGKKIICANEFVQKVQQHFGVKCAYRQVSESDCQKHLQEIGLNRALVRETMDVLEMMQDGNLQNVSDELEKSGEKIVTLEQFLQSFSMRFVE